MPLPIPFQDEINDLFQSDQSIWLKLSAGAFVGVMGGIGGLLNSAPGGNLVIIALIACGLLGSLAVIVLSLRDVVSKRMAAGQRVSFLLRLYLGQGIVSFALSVVTVIVFACFASALWFGYLGL